MDMPATGGSWTRDPKTGDLIPNPPANTTPTQEEPAPAPAAKPKKEA